ncbi:MAG: glycosyltransferase family 2 protein [Paludibacteraceae bacterium]|nr:glycosyltransferase family 2 protein [Paludibacteraceae bacterium]
MKKYRLLVVTVVYRPNLAMLEDFVASYHRYNDMPDDTRLVVVDNSPRDDWDWKSFAQRHSEITYVANQDNIGFGAANNVGFRCHKSDYVLFVNNDVEFTEPVFGDVISLHEASPTVGCIGIRQTGGHPSYFRNLVAPADMDDRVFDERYHFISGAFMMLKSPVFEQIGLFDERIFLYHEEFDLSQRLLRTGYHTMYVPDKTFLHKHQSTRKINVRTHQIGADSFIYVCDKYHLDAGAHSRYYFQRLKKVFVYNLITLRWTQCVNVVRVWRYRSSRLRGQT